MQLARQGLFFGQTAKIPSFRIDWYPFVSDVIVVWLNNLSLYRAVPRLEAIA